MTLINQATFSRYEEFVEAHNGLHPRLQSEEERELAVWATEMGFLCENGEIPAADRDKLHRIRFWADTRFDRTFLNRVREYELWLEEHEGCAPRMNGIGTTYYERSLGTWAAVTRFSIRSKTEPFRDKENRAQILRERVPGLLDNGYQKWNELFRKYVAHVQRDETRSQFVKGGDPLENKLAKWMKWQREEHSYERLPDDRKLALDAAVPGWSDGIDLSWDVTFERYSTFVSRNHGCAPRDAIENKQEQFLYEWDMKMRQSIASGLQPIEQLRAFQGIAARTEHSAACQHLNKPRKRR